MSAISNFIIGSELSGGYKIQEIAASSPSGTGSVFSEGFTGVDSNGRPVFVKVLDLANSQHAADPLKDIQTRVEVFNYERDLIAKCKGGSLRHVVVGVSDGSIFDAAVPLGQIHYIVFELADGDVRVHADLSKSFDLAFCLRCLHNVSVGLWQLHKLGIAHQDVKPSNVLVFEAAKSKLGDLGHAHDRGANRPGTNYQVAGDPNYAPPEHFYSNGYSDWDRRRVASDVYLLGSMISFFFSEIGMTAHITKNMVPAFHWTNNSSIDYSAALPYVRDAFDLSVAEIEGKIPASVRADLKLALSQLCEPDPDNRGHPSNIRGAGARFSVERYISLFDRLATCAEYGMLGKGE